MNFIKTYQQKIVLIAGFCLVSALSFGLGLMFDLKKQAPEIKIEEVFAAPTNNTGNTGQVQSARVDNSGDNCNGKIKGNISSSNKIYHVPGGAFYNRTDAEMCFETEAEAVVSGFRKSSR